MSGSSLVLTKPCRLLYNYGTCNNITFGTNNKKYLIPCGLPNLHRQRICPLVANKPKLKHGVYSSSASNNVPEISTSVVPYVFVGVGFGMTFGKSWEAVMKFVSTKGWKEGVLKSDACYYILLVVTAACIARGFYSNILAGSAVLRNKLFSVGDMIKAGQISGQVIEMGLTTTSLLTDEDWRTAVPTSWLNGQGIVNESRYPTHTMKTDIFVNIDKFEKIPKICEEIRDLMRCNSNVYLDEDQPYCYLSLVAPLSVKISLGCKLKEGEENISHVKHDIAMQAIQIIEKHGAKRGEFIRE